jgi:hypothetical protein
LEVQPAVDGWRKVEQTRGRFRRRRSLRRHVNDSSSLPGVRGVRQEPEGEDGAAPQECEDGGVHAVGNHVGLSRTTSFSSVEIDSCPHPCRSTGLRCLLYRITIRLGFRALLTSDALSTRSPASSRCESARPTFANQDANAQPAAGHSAWPQAVLDNPWRELLAEPFGVLPARTPARVRSRNHPT